MRKINKPFIRLDRNQLTPSCNRKPHIQHLSCEKAKEAHKAA